MLQGALRRQGYAQLAAAVLVLVPLLVALELMHRLTDPEVPESALLPTFLGVAVAVFVILIPVAHGILWRGERARCVRLRCCPACNYDMDGLSPRDDGLTVCPECGAAWRLGTDPGAQGCRDE